MKKLSFLLVGCFLCLLVSACSDQSTPSAVGLEGQTWVLKAYDHTFPIEGREPTLQFSDGHVSGTTGCNHYGGGYQINGDVLHFVDLFNTEMACLDPEGIMEQEGQYLAMLRAGERFELVDSLLTIFTDAQQTLVFTAQPGSPATAEPALEQSASTPVILAAEPTDTPTEIPDFEPPDGFKEYQDPDTGVSIYIPESWAVTGIVTGQYAIFQSYAVDKYVGGEAMQAGDTKCDLNIRPEGASADELVQGWRSDSMTTIVSEQQITLGSGLPGRRFEIDSMGLATIFITEISDRVVVLTCFGDFTQVDALAMTLNPSQ